MCYDISTGENILTFKHDTTFNNPKQLYIYLLRWHYFSLNTFIQLNHKINFFYRKKELKSVSYIYRRKNRFLKMSDYSGHKPNIRDVSNTLSGTMLMSIFYNLSHNKYDLKGLINWNLTRKPNRQVVIFLYQNIGGFIFWSIIINERRPTGKSFHITSSPLVTSPLRRNNAFQ